MLRLLNQRTPRIPLRRGRNNQRPCDFRPEGAKTYQPRCNEILQLASGVMTPFFKFFLCHGGSGYGFLFSVHFVGIWMPN